MFKEILQKFCEHPELNERLTLSSNKSIIETTIDRA